MYVCHRLSKHTQGTLTLNCIILCQCVVLALVCMFTTHSCSVHQFGFCTVSICSKHFAVGLYGAWVFAMVLYLWLGALFHGVLP